MSTLSSARRRVRKPVTFFSEATSSGALSKRLAYATTSAMARSSVADKTVASEVYAATTDADEDSDSDADADNDVTFGVLTDALGDVDDDGSSVAQTSYTHGLVVPHLFSIQVLSSVVP